MMAVSVTDNQRQFNYDEMKLRLCKPMPLRSCRFGEIVVIILSN